MEMFIRGSLWTEGPRGTNSLIFQVMEKQMWYMQKTAHGISDGPYFYREKSLGVTVGTSSTTPEPMLT